MSNTPDNTVTDPETIEGEVVTETVEAKQSFISRMNPLPRIKKHPKIATAIGLGVVLVAGASMYEPKNAEPETDPEYEPSPEAMEEATIALEEMGYVVTDAS